MLTVFERVPEVFVRMYDAQFSAWAREYRLRGSRCAIVFDRFPGMAVMLDEEGRPVMRGAWFVAHVDGINGVARMVVRPASEHDEEMVARHVSELSRRVMQ